MKIGMNLPVMVPGLDRAGLRAWSQRIDTGPFETLCAGERVNFPNPDMGVVLAAAAAMTERVRIMSSVLVLPMHATALVAKQVATLDVLSGGRVVLGVGVGARPDDYAAAEAPFDGRRFARLEEQVGLLRRMWRGELLVPGATRPVEPRPLQPEGPEILAGALGPKSIRRAARWADGLNGFSFGPWPEEIATGFERARGAWKEAGRERPPRLTTSFWFALGPRPREQLDTYLARYLAFMGAGVAGKLAPQVRVTSPQALREALRAVADVGADEVMLVPTTADPDEVHRVADCIG